MHSVSTLKILTIRQLHHISYKLANAKLCMHFIRPCSLHVISDYSRFSIILPTNNTHGKTLHFSPSHHIFLFTLHTNSNDEFRPSPMPLNPSTVLFSFHIGNCIDVALYASWLRVLIVFLVFGFEYFLPKRFSFDSLSTI